MIRDINFLTTKISKKQAVDKNILILRVAGVFSLFAVLLLTVLGFFLKSIVYSPVIKIEQNKLVESMNTLRDKQVKLTLVEGRIKDVSDIIKNQNQKNNNQAKSQADYSEILNSFSQSIPSGVSILSLKVDGNTVILNLSSGSLQSAQDLIDNLIELGNKKIFVNLTLNNLSLNQIANVYTFSITANL